MGLKSFRLPGGFTFSCLSLQLALSPGSLARHSSYTFSEIKQGCCTVIRYRQQSQCCLWKWAYISQVSGNRVQGGFWRKRKSLQIRNFLLPKSLLLILIRETKVGENYVFSAWAEFYTVGFRDWECVCLVMVFPGYFSLSRMFVHLLIQI